MWVGDYVARVDLSDNHDLSATFLEPANDRVRQYSEGAPEPSTARGITVDPDGYVGDHANYETLLRRSTCQDR